jgi:hypothetical protein
MLPMSALRRLREEECEFEVSMGYMVGLYLKKKKQILKYS